MMVSNRMVKPHMVKKWARPGTVHCRSFFWPATSTASASALGATLPRVRLGSFLPERMSLDSQWKRNPAIPKPMRVTAMPKMYLTGTNAPRLRLLQGQSNSCGGGSASATWDFNAAQRIVGRSSRNLFGGLPTGSPAPGTPVGCP